MEHITYGIKLINAIAAKGDSLEEMLPKALASFMFREIIEDAHVEYGISQEDIICNPLYVYIISRKQRKHSIFGSGRSDGVLPSVFL